MLYGNDIPGLAGSEYKLIKMCPLSPFIEKDAFVCPPQIKMLIRSTSFMFLGNCLLCGVHRPFSYSFSYKISLRIIYEDEEEEKLCDNFFF